jgi:hypothetical protein
MEKHACIDEYLPPRDRYQVLKTHIWWNPKIQGIGLGFSRNRVAQLDRHGLVTIQNIWDFKNNQLLQESGIS